MPKYEDHRPWRNWYNLSVWVQGRRDFLIENPLCCYCVKKKPPHYTPATIVDHIKPHRGVWALFIDRTNWQALCVECHNRIKQAIEASRFTPIGDDGWPIGE